MRFSSEIVFTQYFLNRDFLSMNHKFCGFLQLLTQQISQLMRRLGLGLMYTKVSCWVKLNSPVFNSSNFQTVLKS